MGLYPTTYYEQYPLPSYAYATGNFNFNIPGVSFKNRELDVNRGGKRVQIKGGKVYINGKLMTGSAGISGGKAVCRSKVCKNGKCVEGTTCRGGSGTKQKMSGAGLDHQTNQSKEPKAEGEPATGAEPPAETGGGTGDPISDFIAWIQGIINDILASLGLA